MAKKKIEFKFPLNHEHGPHKFLGVSFSDELTWSNPLAGKPLRDKDRIYTVEMRNNLDCAFFHKDTGAASVMVRTDVKKLKALARAAEKARKYFDKLDKKARRPTGIFFKHFGNVTFLVEPTTRKKKGARK